MIKCIFENGNETSLRHVVVDCLVVKDNQILLTKRAPHLSNGGKYGLIGGYIDRDETIEQGAIREIKEETGYQATIIKLLKIVDSPNRPQEDRQNVSFVYLVEPLGKVDEPDNETTELKWFDLNNLPLQGQFAFDHYDHIQFYLQ